MYFAYGEKETEYLRKRDKKLAEVIDKVGHIDREVDTDLFSSVVHHIIGQQISTKAQATIWQRMCKELGVVCAESILAAGETKLQSYGMTFRKAEYLTDFAKKVQAKEFDLEGIWEKSDEEAIRELSSLKGIGVWTAEMILLFCMQRPDVFSYGDLAILRGMKILYGKEEISREFFETYRKRFSPYCSVASLYLWAVAGGAVPGMKGYTWHYDSPLGGITLASDGEALTGLWFDGQKYFADTLASYHEEKNLPVFAQTKKWLDLYFRGKNPDFIPPLQLNGSEFRKKVWDILLTIPYGETMTYGEIARRLAAETAGSRTAADAETETAASRTVSGARTETAGSRITAGAGAKSRVCAQAVGGAVGHNPISLIVPCHRVVGADGSMTGYAGGIDKKVQLLKLEQNLKDIQKSFGTQAKSFDSNSYHLSKAEYQQYMIDKTGPQKTDRVLEVAAGTCICGRAFAPYVSQVTCLDATPAMLQVGKDEAEKAGLTNMDFVEGIAESLPFPEGSFDIVMSRLAFHHFVNPERIFAEMKRVLKPGGKLVLMDMTVQEEDPKDQAATPKNPKAQAAMPENPKNQAVTPEVPDDQAAALETLREKVDALERLRDFSHVRDLTLAEMRDLYRKNDLQLLLQEKMDIPVSLTGWMALTHTPEQVQKEIIRRMEQDMAGGEATGFAPYRKDGEIYFNHHWVFNLGIAS